MDPFDPVYLTSGLGIYLVGVAIVGRMLRSAVILRERYRSVLESLEESIRENKKKTTTDPTLGFLGVKWWGLPATLAAVLVGIWVLLEWLGIDILFESLL